MDATASLATFGKRARLTGDGEIKGEEGLTTLRLAVDCDGLSHPEPLDEPELNRPSVARPERGANGGKRLQGGAQKGVIAGRCAGRWSPIIGCVQLAIRRATSSPWS